METLPLQGDYEKQAYVISYLVILIVVTAIFRNRGFFVCSMVLMYVVALSSMSLVLKNVFVEQAFDFPVWLTSIHFLCTSICAFCVLACRAFMTKTPITTLQVNTLLRGVGPLALCLSLSIGFSNKGLSFSNVHFYEMVESAAPLVTAFIAVAMGNAFNKRLLFPLGLVACALMCCWCGEAQFSWLAFAYLLLGTILRACTAVLNQIYLTAFTTSPTEVLDPVELVMYTSLMSFFLMGSWSFALDGATPFHQFWLLTSFAGRLSFAMSAVVAIVINFAGIFIIRELGAVAQQLTANLKGALSVLGGVAIRREILSIPQTLGFLVVVCGIAWYDSMTKKLKDGEKGKESETLLKKVKS